MRRRTPAVALLAAAQLVLVGVAVAPQLSARLTGDEVLLRVAPVDPIDPFRGAYVDLDYPDLLEDQGGTVRGDAAPGGTVFVVLRDGGDGVMVLDRQTRRRPAEGTYLACSDRGWRTRCGIESWFLPQDEARALEREVAGGDLVARVRVDRWGDAALVGLEPADEG